MKDRELLEDIFKTKSESYKPIMGAVDVCITESVYDEILKHFTRKPKERIQVSVFEGDGRYFVAMDDCLGFIDPHKTRKKAIQWCNDRGLEVIND